MSMLVPTFIKPDARNRLSFKAKVEQYGIVSLVKIGPIEFFFYRTVAEAEEMGRKNKEVCVSSSISSKCNPTETDIFLAKQKKIASIEHLFQTSQCTLCFLGWRAIANCRTCQLGLFHRQLDTVANTEPLAI